jgi:hypothetical protein
VSDETKEAQMTDSVQAIVAAAQQLTPTEQLEVIQALSRSLQRRYQQSAAIEHLPAAEESRIPATIRRTDPVTDLAHFAADFWPEDETADDINTFITQQRIAEA